jgi:hypothetical protein
MSDAFFQLAWETDLILAVLREDYFVTTKFNEV